MYRNIRYFLRAVFFSCWIIICSLVFAELFLQSAGAVVRLHAKALHSRPVMEIPEDFIKILCVGDSHVFGMGAPNGMSYPAQLERMLGNRASQRFAVINAGVPGATTLRVREELPELIDIYNPAVVFVFAGVNNYNWDSDYWFSSSRSRTLSLFARTRLWRLFVMAKIRIRTLLLADSLKRSVEDRTFSSVSSGTDRAELLESADRYIAEGRYEDAFSCLMAVLYHSLDADADFICAGQGIGAAVRLPVCWSVFIDVCRRMVHIPDAVKRLEQSGADGRIGTLVRGFLTNRLDVESRISDWVANDMRAIVDICRTKGAVPVIIGYFGEDELDVTLRTVAARTGTAFIDNIELFDSLGSLRPEYFAPDRHPNAKGYELIARKAFALVLELL